MESRNDLKHAAVLEPTNKAVKQELQATDKEEMQKKKKKTGMNDYSRFDNLDISDDEEEEKPKVPERSPPTETTKKTSPRKAPVKASEPSKEEEDEEDLGLPNKAKKKNSSKYWWDAGSGAPTSTSVITPQKIESPPQKVEKAASNQAGSVWNNAGTWEEKENANPTLPYLTRRDPDPDPDPRKCSSTGKTDFPRHWWGSRQRGKTDP